MANPLDIFQKRIEVFKNDYQILNRKYNVIAVVRIATFILFLIVSILAANYRMGTLLGLTVLAFPFVFGTIIILHNRISYERKQAGFLQSINEKETLIGKGNLSEQDKGEEYIDAKHAYTNDLDIFGANSLFQLVNRTSTGNGKNALASWLQTKATKEEIENRHLAIKELAPKIDWRQDFQAKGMHNDIRQLDYSPLLSWLKESIHIKPLYKGFAMIMPVITFLLIGLNIFSGVSFYYTLAAIFINFLVVSRFNQQMKDLSEAVIDHVGVLKSYSSLIKHLEESSFTTDYLQKLQSYFEQEGSKASLSISRLQKILDLLNARSNFLYFFINYTLLFDLVILIRSERWKRKNQADIALWFDTIGEFEAISSLSAFQFSNPGYTLPAIDDNEFILSGESLGHPLIKSNERVTNDFKMTGEGAITIITGSNMSGKSTFLRTLGVNMVLAFTGAPVCANKLSLSLMQIFTGMRTVDNLEEHVSSFYAELKRIKALLDLVELGQPVFYMLDEILKGTNSKDRHIGAVALAKQLSKTRSFGLISTHDLDLGKLDQELNNVVNYSFNSQIEGNEIIFPYLLEKGICRSFNASKLMENMGIKIK
ncbi:MAG TPA: DNA mismatch repair protein MutS [Fulvivirga sp.]|nr:DNA mismatch repair protein MutS [Fulvivirga sp.]